MSRSKSASEEVVRAFRDCRLWRTAGDMSVRALADSARVEDVAQGARLVTEGEAAKEFGVLVSGQARVFYLGADGKQITLEVVGVASPIAAVAVMAGSRFPANVEASTQATVAWVKREALFRLLQAEPAVVESLLSDLAARLVNLTSVVQTLALDGPNRLARFIFNRSLETGRPVKNGLSVELGVKKSELATSLGTVPETLSRAFAKLRDDGVLIVEGNSVTVADVRALAALASGYED